jgi:hypothetical protein
VLIKAELPAVNINITPDVYNGLVNLGKILSSVNASEDLKLMKEEKERLLLTAAFKGEILTRGVVRSKIYFEEYFMIVAGQYIYFYKNRFDFVPQLYLSLQEITMNTHFVQPDSASKVEHFIVLQSRSGYEIHLKFEIKDTFNKF